MATITATCGDCGPVRLDPQEIELRVQPDGQQGQYRFFCPTCGIEIEKVADAGAVRLLLAGGVTPWMDTPTRPLLTYDDLLDFHDLLATDGWFDGLVTLVSKVRS